MSSSLQTPTRKPEAYHHGNLRQTLLDAARDLAAEVGVDAFTLREVARRAGVSHAAPYHHFADKAALVRALAIRAFEALTREMTEAANTVTDPLQRVQRIGSAYVRFAYAHQSEFKFMFRKDLCLPDSALPDDLERSGMDAYRVLLDGIEACQKSGRMPAGTDVQLLALTMWSTVHGLAALLLDAPTHLADTPEQVEGILSAVTRILTHGLIVLDAAAAGPDAPKKGRLAGKPRA